MPDLSPPSYRFKVGAAVALIAAADLLFYRQPLGVNLAVYGLLWAGGAFAVLPALRRDPRALAALTLAAGFSLLLLERPTVFVTVFLTVALGVAVLSPRARATDDVWPWLQRLVVAALRGLLAPLHDLKRLRARRLRGKTGGKGLVRLSVLIMPVVGGLMFITLFAAANPLIEAGLKRLHFPQLDFARAAFWLVVGIVIWMVLRPRGLRRFLALPDGRGDREIVGVTPGSVLLSLVVFNALFALQNGLDVAFLWSGAPLPEGVTLAGYAHRGAYLLIFTAILAGAFVLLALRRGSTLAGMASIRWLVALFVAQNVLLVASSALRTIDYVEAYGLTRMRISALAWMGLVALGLVLAGVRLLRDKSSAWLINANVLATALVLLATSLIDLGLVSADWNTRNARELNGHGPPLDLAYLRAIGPAALVPLITLEGRALSSAQRGAVVTVRVAVMNDVQRKQANWRTWSWRDQRRLEQARRILAGRPTPPTATVPALTAPAQPGT